MAPEAKLPEGITRSNPARPAPRTNAQLADAFEEWLRVLNRSRTVLYTRPRTVRKFAGSLDGRSLLEADRQDVRAFAAGFGSVHERAHAIWALRNFYDFLTLGDLAQRNPAREVCTPKLPHRLPHVPTVEEVERLLQAVEDLANGEAE